ncbi:MAG: right-handed parallel beta-helix repeat-containing protein [Ginsengibacter sp.]
MKEIIIIALIWMAGEQELFAKNYHFSTSQGNDNRTFEQAQRQSTPWKSLEKLNAIMVILKPGDSVLFKRGDVFVGTIKIRNSGSESKPIVFASYGNKNRPNPEINGRITLNKWTKYDENIWESDGSQLSDKVNYFTINSKVYPMGRYPNSDETSDGFMHFESVDSSLSITDDELNGMPNWTGAEIVIKPRRWLIDRNLITKHEGHTLWYNSSSSYIPERKFGYFIQNHFKTLDRFGEWYFDVASKKVYVYFGDKLPQHYNLQASRFGVLLDINNQHNVLISGISFVGANEDGVSLTNTKNIVIKNCTIMYSGLNGISGSEVSNLLVENNKVQDVNNTGLYFIRDCSNTIIRGNMIKRCGIIDGTGPSGNSKTEGLALGGNNNIIEYNVIDSIGYIGLYFSGDDVLVKNNVISNFTMSKDDGGGIYVISGKKPRKPFKNRKIIGNIVMNGIGNGAGTSRSKFRSAIGIYMDDGTNHVDILDNIVGNCAEIGIFLHDASFINVQNNLSYNCDIPFAMHQDVIWEGGSMHNNEIENNIFVSSMENPLLESFRTQENNVVNFGKLDNNYFLYPSSLSSIQQKLFKEVIERSKVLKYDITEWQQKYSYEKNSLFNEIDPQDFGKKIRIEYNDAKKMKTIKLGNAKYENVEGKKYTGSINLRPYSWVYLTKTDKE